MKNWRIPTNVEEVLKLQNLMNSTVFTRDIIKQIYSLMYIDSFENEVENDYKNKDCSYKDIKPLIIYYIKELSMRFLLTPHFFNKKVNANALISFSMLAENDLYSSTVEKDTLLPDDIDKIFAKNMLNANHLNSFK